MGSLGDMQQQSEELLLNAPDCTAFCLNTQTLPKPPPWRFRLTKYICFFLFLSISMLDPNPSQPKLIRHGGKNSPQTYVW